MWINSRRGARAAVARFLYLIMYKTHLLMTRYILAIIVIATVASCKAPTEITARPDPTAATSGTIGSSKATDGIIPFKPVTVPDSTRKR
jgi:hypothetical protein